jgi:predicted ATP-grasp superfamily ATP-dependent carboligase
VRDPQDLYTVHSTPADLGRPVLLHSLAGFLDAGAAGRLAVEQLLRTLESTPVASFDIDTLYDYRARRPRMTFLSDHYETVDLPELELSLLRDDAGTAFLLLHGVEPDFGWQGFADAVRSLVDRFAVPLTVGMHAVPWPAPHTRPLGLTAHATDPELVAGRTSWVGALEVPGHLAGLLELRLGRSGHQAMGFAAHVPHYLAGTEHPRAALGLLEAVSAATGLLLPLDALREAADRTDAETDAQIAQNPENVEAVHALEQQYDAFVAQAGGAPGSTGTAHGDGTPMPSGEEIAAQVEQFLAEMQERGRDDQL